MSEREDFITILNDQRSDFLTPIRGLTEEQARATPSASALSLGGLLKHVTLTEQHWLQTISDADPKSTFDMEGAATAYVMTDDETYDGWLAQYEALAESTAAFIRDAPDLDAQIPLPTAPWAPEREYRSVRWILLHIFRETAQHAGHADIIRETLDGSSTTMAKARAAGLDF